MAITQQTIEKLLCVGETEHVEFKTSFGKAVIESLCAFANHEGGVVIVGVGEQRGGKGGKGKGAKGGAKGTGELCLKLFTCIVIVPLALNFFHYHLQARS